MLRADGDRGFLFVNNYVRNLEMPERPAFQVRVKLVSGTVDLPRTPIDIPANSHFIWPLNLDIGGAGTLVYSTAQLLSRLDNPTETTYFFFAPRGLRSEFAFDAGNVSSVETSSGKVARSSDGMIQVGNVQPGKETSLEVTGKNGRRVRILLMTEAQAEQFWRVLRAGPSGNQDTVLLSPADVFAADDGVHLRSVDPTRITAQIYLPNGEKDNPQALWHEEAFEVEPRKIEFEWGSSREAASRPPIRMDAHVGGRNNPMPLAPDGADFRGAAAWTLQIPAQPMNGMSDIFLRVRYAGDVARLSLDGRLLDDDFYNGRTWEIGLKRFLPESFGKKLEVSILPLPRKAPIYLDARAWAPMNAEGQTGKVLGVDLLPEYEAVLKPSSP